MKFSKMHGLGNDYIYIDLWRESGPQDPTALAIAISNRHRGVGSDGLILVGPPKDPMNADAKMDMYNADGSISEMCGNGLRCAAKFAWDHGQLNKEHIRFETGAGTLLVHLHIEEYRDGYRCTGATVNMGKPRLLAADIPVNAEDSTPCIVVEATIDENQDDPEDSHRLLCIGMGNPHAVCFVDNAEQYPVSAIGPQLETHALFPNRSNIEFVSLLGSNADDLPILRQRTWERGSGETEACGTGACATCIAAILDGMIDDSREAIIRLNGGDLHIRWPTNDGPIYMSGPASFICDGEWPL